MRRFRIATLLHALVLLRSAPAQRGPEPLLIEPTIAPDGSTVAFSGSTPIAGATPIPRIVKHRAPALVDGSFRSCGTRTPVC